MSSSAEFWVDNIFHLFSSQQIIPKSKDPFCEQMNCLTRFVILFFVVTAFITNRFPAFFFLFSIMLLIILYYSFQQFEHQKEFYGDVPTVTEPIPKIPWYSPSREFVFTDNQDNPRTRCQSNGIPNRSQILLPHNAVNPQFIDSGQSSAWCPQDADIIRSIDQNQRLAGPPNPKTLVRPVIPTPIYEFDTWRPNDFVIPRDINDQKRQELYDNGYMPSFEETETVEDYSEYANLHQDAVDTGCGYQPVNLEYQMPVNYPASPCQKTPEMKNYNRNLFTIPIQPDLNTRSYVNQTDASMSNLGISFTQPFLPTSFDPKDNSFIEHDPAFAPPCRSRPLQSEYPFRNEIYDPRLTGYGPSSRHYIDPMTGQSRFYYDDIDQHTQTNYITRNKIDFANFGTNAGPVRGGSLEGTMLRNTADQMYTDSQIGFRSELQQRLMHKNNNREWQQRIAPISTMNQRRAGGGKSSASTYSGPRGG